MSVARGTVHSIQFLRFLAATLVVVYHGHLAIAADPARGVGATEAYLFHFGAVGVHVFFVISGYIMYLTNVGRGDAFRPGQFYARRLIRIYPVYWIFVGIYVAVRFLLGTPYALGADEAAGTLALWPGQASNVIGPAWTLTFEMYFYLAFGIAMLLGARRGTWALTLVFVTAIVARHWLPKSLPVIGWLMTDTMLLEFVAGVWIARLTAGYDWARGWGIAAVAAAAALYGGGIVAGFEQVPAVVAWGPPSALLVFGFVVLERRGGVPGTRRLSVLGDSSYSLYLCHILLIDVLLAALAAVGVRLPVLATVALTTLIAIGFAHGFFLTVERPVVRLLHRLTERRRTPRVAPVA